ncbi:BURP domain protein USPL1-like [Arachis stenosperma]|uniref:BURP domain protein USPL1-like n=1 Tax=Arachis stenosperma TaxID=217475 RepID=UPI0025ACC718|nr:BURP domain protein USPL1-like [Arachis stenosperma]
MVTKLTLWVLLLLLFFLMNRHVISGRDLKVELQDDTDTNSQSYINHEKPNEPYITSYATSSNKLNYLTGYKTGAHGSDKDFSLSSTNKPYITGYTTTPRDAKQPYITQYGDEPSGSNKEIKTKSATAQDSAKPYLTSYGPRSKETQSSNVDHTEAFKVGFFAIDDLYVGNIMTLQFPVEDFSHFLSKKDADSIPFSTSQLPSVLQLFSISEDSAQAKSMKATIEQCEAGTITGETKICANSLESMLEFVHNIIGAEEKHNIHTTTPSSGAPLQKYTILKISEDIYAPKWVACHPMPYPYGVYYCHFISTGTRVFKVLLDGENGDKVEALGVCHLDTSDWSPNHILFKQLGFMPGEAPVCHFFPVKHLMWVPQPSTVTM